MAVHDGPRGENGLSAISKTELLALDSSVVVALHVHGELKMDTSIWASAASMPVAADATAAPTAKLAVDCAECDNTSTSGTVVEFGEGTDVVVLPFAAFRVARHLLVIEVLYLSASPTKAVKKSVAARFISTNKVTAPGGTHANVIGRNDGRL